MWLIQSESEYSQLLDFMAIEYLEVIFPEENKVFLSLSSGLSLAQPGEQFGHNCVAYTYNNIHKAYLITQVGVTPSEIVCIAYSVQYEALFTIDPHNLCYSYSN